jgi:diaminohydroxyphosphoribosylaminopyrimidine deaminase/5-amino-6-(5-phosphoribosylamino)uracil reductase
MNRDRLFLQRCFDLARLGTGSVSPNPTVGAVLVAHDRIIGEGFHETYGQAHAEVNALRSVSEKDRRLIPESTLYVSLEPCCIYGRTPPCTQLILENKIPRVVIAGLDQTPGVAGRGVAILREQGVEVTILDQFQGGRESSLIRNHFVVRNRPFVILKFARSRDGFMGRPGKQVWLSNALSKRLVHKWRAEVDAIMVGTNTARIDNPRLNNRLFPGAPPLRIVPDRTLSLPENLHLKDGHIETWILTERKEGPPPSSPNLKYLLHPFSEDFLPELMKKLAESQRSSLLVEGGARLLNSFIRQNLWDEARIIDTPRYLKEGVIAPQITGDEIQTFPLETDHIRILRNPGAV